MQTNALSVAQGLLYFSDSISREVKNGAYSLFCDTWAKIPKEDQQVLEEHLEYILIKPINDPLHPNTAAFTRVSPTIPTWNSWIMWYPLFPLVEKRELSMFCLAHELAHVFLLHPQQGSQMTTEDENAFKSKAEDEANEITKNKWKILLPEDQA